MPIIIDLYPEVAAKLQQEAEHSNEDFNVAGNRILRAELLHMHTAGNLEQKAFTRLSKSDIPQD